MFKRCGVWIPMGIKSLRAPKPGWMEGRADLFKCRGSTRERMMDEQSEEGAIQQAEAPSGRYRFCHSEKGIRVGKRAVKRAIEMDERRRRIQRNYDNRFKAKLARIEEI